MKRYELIEHTADIAIKAYGDNLPEAFAAAAGGLFEIMTGGTDIEAKRNVRLEAKSIDREGLLVGFLSDLLLQFEVEQLVLKDFEVTFERENSLTATAHGERFDEKRHAHGYHVKGVSYHMMEIVDVKGTAPSHVQVLFDI